MDTRDGEVQRLATQRVWSEDEGPCLVAAWRPVACGGRARSRARTRTGRVPSRARAAGAR